MITDRFRLTSVQEAMLYNHLANPCSGVDVEQVIVGYPDSANIPCLQRAWKLVVQRHPVLRTGFRHQEDGQSIQEVHADVDLTISRRHWDGTQEQFDRFLREDRLRGFDLARAPLMRLTYFDAPDRKSVLVWTVHHALVDGRAMLIVFAEIEDFYRQLMAGEDVSIEHGPSYRPYVDWLQDHDFAQHRAFWCDYLEPFTTPTPLPEDSHLATATPSGYGGKERRLPIDVSRKLREIAEQYGVTLNTLVMAAWGILLARYSGQDKVLFGASKSSRKSSVPHADRVVGLFLNTLPIRLDLSPDKRLIEVLQQLRTDWLLLRDHEHVPLSQIKAACAIPPGVPLVDSLVVFEHARLNQVLARTYPAWRDRHYRALGQPNFGLSFSAYANPEILLKLEYEAERFSSRRIDSLLEHLQEIFTCIAKNPEANVADVGGLPATHKQQLLVQWNATGAEYTPAGLHELIEEHAARTPNAVAVTFDSGSLTYAQLNESANRLAFELRNIGAGPNALVGVCAERSLETMVAFLAIAKSGAAYVPLDPHLPPGRVQYMIEDSGLNLAVTDCASKHVLAGFQGRLIHLNDTKWLRNPSCNVQVQRRPEDLAYVIYTSGSTGQPKGVAVPNRALMNLLQSVRDSFPFGSQDRLLAVTTISFDISGVDIWLPWISGGQTILASRDDSFDGQRLRQLVEQHRATFLQATPVTWRLLLQAGWPGADIKAVCTGEAMPRELAATLLPMVGGLWNMYGPTETTIWSTGYEVKSASGPVLIGKPIANTRCYVLDSQRQPVPIGAVGELCIAGDGLADGYLKRPELTADKFVPDPFHAGQRMFLTGDLARYDHDGNIECLGRIDRQLKLRGFRIEPAEIEAALERVPGIGHAVVVARDDDSGNRRLVGYFEHRSAPPSSAELRTALRQELPDYMVPAEFVSMDRLPYNTSGKVDVAALPAPDFSGHEAAGRRVEFGDETEQQIASIWEQVLHVGDIGPQDDFFDVGGDSLLSVHVLWRMRQAFQVELSPADIVNARTPAALARVVKQRRTDTPESLVCVCEGNSQHRIFFAPSVFLDNEYYLAKRLSEKLGPEQSVYCFRLASLRNDVQFETVDELAEYCAQVIHRFAGDGPCHLVGYSMGGLVAYEIARKLESSSYTVQTLAIIDTGPRGLKRGLEPLEHPLTFVSNIARLVAYRARRGDLGTAISATLRKLRDRVTGNHKTPTGRLNQYFDPSMINSVPDDVRNAMHKRFTLWEQHVPGPYNGKLLLIKAKLRPLYRGLSRDLGWGQLVRGGVEILEIPGAHAHIPENDECLIQMARGITDSIRAYGLEAPDEEPRVSVAAVAGSNL